MILIGKKRWLLAGLVALSACAAKSDDHSPVASLQQTQSCKGTIPPFGYSSDSFYPPKGTIRMGNDGGWCWVEFVFTSRGSYDRYEDSVATVGVMRVSTPPQHGDVLVGSKGEGVRLAYRPKPGFSGSDSFHVFAATPQHDFDILVEVTVGN